MSKDISHIVNAAENSNMAVQSRATNQSLFGNLYKKVAVTLTTAAALFMLACTSYSTQPTGSSENEIDKFFTNCGQEEKVQLGMGFKLTHYKNGQQLPEEFTSADSMIIQLTQKDSVLNENGIKVPTKKLGYVHATYLKHDGTQYDVIVLEENQKYAVLFGNGDPERFYHGGGIALFKAFPNDPTSQNQLPECVSVGSYPSGNSDKNNTFP